MNLSFESIVKNTETHVHMNKKVVWSIISILIIAVLITAKKQGWIFSEGEALVVDVYSVEPRDLVEVVTSSGKIRPAAEVKLAPEVSGEIFELQIREGDEVKKGQLLVKINPDLYTSAQLRAKASTNNARASFNQAEAQFVEAEKSFKRNRDLHKNGVISDAEFDGAQREFDVARLGVEAARFQIKSAQASETEASDNLKRTTIYAPASGIVSMLNVEVGERVVGTAQMAGTELLRISDLNRMQVKVEVNENEVIRVSAGDSVSIGVEAYPDERFYGKVSQVALASRSDEKTSADQITVFDVLIDIAAESYAHLETKYPLRHGMTATVDIVTRKVFDVLAVPVQAVTTRMDSTGDNSQLARARASKKTDPFTCVFTIRDNRALLQRVNVGLQDDAFIHIKEGIKEGDVIASGPFGTVAQELKHDVPVQIKVK